MAAPATSPQRLLMPDDRRAVRKAVVDSGLVTVELCQAGFGLLVNVSERGLAVYTMKKLTPAEDVQVSFMLPGSPRRIECNGQVKWAANSHAGLQLKGLDPQSLSALKRWLATLPQLPAVEDPKLQRRPFPARGEQVHAIQTHIADERLELDRALQFIISRLLDLTAANGGAIALGEPAQMVCRASAGLAPEIGVQISSTSGVTGECIRTGKEIYCEDTELDPRVDREACRELNLRSSLIVPVLRRDKVAGVLEAFASVPSAFQEDHRWLVKRLAEVAAELAYGDVVKATIAVPAIAAPPLESIARAAESPSTPTQAEPLAAETPLAAVLQKQVAQRSFVSRVKPFWPLSLFTVSILLLSLAWHNSKPTADRGVTPAPTVAAAPSFPTPSTDSPTTTLPDAVPAKQEPKPHTAPQVAKSPSEPAHDETAADSVVIALPRASGSRETVTQPDTAPTVQFADSANIPGLAIPTSTDAPELVKAGVLTGGALLHRVQPIYPEIALQQGRQGDVVLRAHVNRRGKVTSVQKISGDSMLAFSGIAAIRQWRYEPFKRDGIPQEIDTTITLQFRAPKRQ
jgi:TonB family protein